MDPIHPILPQPINIPPVTQPPSVGRIDRDERRKRGEQDDDAQEAQRRFSEEHGEHADADADDRGPRIDLTA
jgi:hypothetical protein